MIRVGLTGGIGSGKTTVSKLFKELGIPVFNSDLCARESENEVEIQEAYKQILGNDILVDGHFDRAKIRKIIFTDKSILAKINDIVIPYVSKSFEAFIIEHKDAPYVMLESAILFETDKSKNFDYIILVTAETDVRIQRVLNRDSSTLEEVQNKLNNQWPEADKIEKANFIIKNNGDDLIDSLYELGYDVCTIHNILTN